MRSTGFFLCIALGLSACAESNTGGDHRLDLGPSLADLSVPLSPDLATQPIDMAMRPSGTVRFAAIGDTGKGDVGQIAVANAIAQKCQASGCDFVLLLGDNIYESGATSAMDSQFQSKFEQPYAAIDVPFYVVLGNHDYGGGGTGNEFDKPENEVNYTANSTKWKMPARAYHFPSGPAEFFALDTNAVMWEMAGVWAPQLSNWISASTAKWKIAFGHHMYISNGKHGDAGSYDGVPSWVPIASGKSVKTFLEDHVCGQVDLYICGHDHNRQWLTETCKGTELVVSGAGASTTPLQGTHPTHFQSDALGFYYVSIDGGTLTAEFVDVNGAVEYTRTITKP